MTVALSRLARSLLMRSPLAGAIGAALAVARRRPLLKALVYHDVPPERVRAFRQHLELLMRHYHVCTPGDFLATLRGERPLTQTEVMLTFDDGYASQARVARDVLDPLGVRGLFFVATGFLDTAGSDASIAYARDRLRLDLGEGGSLPAYQRPMSWDELAALVAEGHVVGAHTVSHARLTELASEDEVREEVVASGDAIAGRLGVPVDCFAYPFGTIESIDARSLALIEQRYAACFSGVRGSNAVGGNPYAILRDVASVDDSPGGVRFLVEDGLGPLYGARARRLAAMAPSSG